MGTSPRPPASLRTVALILSVLAYRRRLRRDHWSRPSCWPTSGGRWRGCGRTPTKSPFYRDFHAGLTDAPLSELPVLTKQTLMDNFDRLVTTQPSSAGGRRAVPGPPARQRAVPGTATTSRRRPAPPGGAASSCGTSRNGCRSSAPTTGPSTGPAQPPGLTHRVKTAVVSSTNPSHQSARVGASIHSRWVPTLRIDSATSLASIVARLNGWQPADADRLRLDAAAAGRGATGWPAQRSPPQFIFSASEVLTDATRRLAKAAWGRPPFNVYGATETSGIAAECGQHTGMHLFEDLVITEVVDADNRPVPPGEYGAKVLVTVLFSRTLPLIRYEMSDSLQLGRRPRLPLRPALRPAQRHPRPRAGSPRLSSSDGQTAPSNRSSSTTSWTGQAGVADPPTR